MTTANTQQKAQDAFQESLSFPAKVKKMKIRVKDILDKSNARIAVEKESGKLPQPATEDSKQMVKEMAQKAEKKERFPAAKRNPDNLPPIGPTKEEIEARTSAVEASMKAFPEVYHPGWGYNLAFIEFLKKENNVQDWRNFVKEIDEIIQEDYFASEKEIEKALNAVFEFIAKGSDEEEQVRRGLIVGIFDREYDGISYSIQQFNVHRWYNCARLAQLFSVELNDKFKDIVESHDVSFCSKNEQYHFAVFLQCYGEIFHNGWESTRI